MANPRELAEKAFTLLQDALRDSESRASELDAELKRQRQPKNRVEERLEVLAHRLEAVEAECQRWQREAGQLEELLENERAKLQQLRKKLEVAESGPDRLTKKEVNFWRERAEQFDAETREYKNRIQALKQELESRAEDGGMLESTREPQPQGDTEALARALETAHTEATDLRRALADREVVLTADLEQARSELERTRAELEQGRRAIANFEAAQKRASETVREREARLAEAAAEIDKTRAELANRDNHEQVLGAELAQVRAEIAVRDAHIGALMADIDALRRAEQQRGSDLHEIEARTREQLDTLQRQSAAETDRLRSALEARVAEAEQLRTALEGRAGEIEQLRASLDARGSEAEQLRANLEARSGEAEQLRAGKERLQRELSDLLSRNDSADGERRAQFAALRAEINRKDAEIGEAQARLAEVDRAREGLREEQRNVREQIAGLETELKEEKECTANLSELANERKEALTRLEERVEEAEERYEEAKWRLGKAVHFERLVRRRKGLVKALIGAVRAKSKANSALKAGLDGLRTFKATAEANQHKLLARLDKLNAGLKEAESAVAKHQGATQVNEDLITAQAKIVDLEGRLNTQVEIIQTLEADLKSAKAMQHARDNHGAALEGVRKQLEAKDQIITQLQADADEQQRKLSKLRGSESETVRLKALEEKDKGRIDTLQREIAQLRDAVAQWKRKYEFLAAEAPQAYQSVAEK